MPLKTLSNDQVSFSFVRKILDCALHVEEFNSVLLGTRDQIYLDCLYFFRCKLIPFCQDWYDTCELLKLFYRHEILLFDAVAVEKIKDQVNSSVFNFSDFTSNFLVVTKMLNFYLSARLSVNRHSGLQFSCDLLAPM